MSDNQILILIILACLIMMGISIVIKKTHLIASIVLKALLGLVSIHLMNEFLGSLKMNFFVGMNVGTALTIGFFGLPGFVLLYLLAIYDQFIQ